MNGPAAYFSQAVALAPRGMQRAEAHDLVAAAVYMNPSFCRRATSSGRLTAGKKSRGAEQFANVVRFRPDYRPRALESGGHPRQTGARSTMRLAAPTTLALSPSTINPPSRTLNLIRKLNNVCTEHLPRSLQKHNPVPVASPSKGGGLGAKFRYKCATIYHLIAIRIVRCCETFILASFVGLLLGGISFGQTPYKVLVFSATPGFG